MSKQAKYQTYSMVIIEWDGEQPPTRWYDRLHRTAGAVRGDKDLSVIERRGDKAVIVQEGCILCTSESLARYLALQARDEYEASHVMVGTAKVTDMFGASRADLEIMRQVESVLGARGRRPDPKPHVIACLEELTAHVVNEPRPYQCPSCNGLRIKHYPMLKGQRAHLNEYTFVNYNPDQDHVFDLWLATHFAQQTWLPAWVNVQGMAKPAVALGINTTTQTLTLDAAQRLAGMRLPSWYTRKHLGYADAGDPDASDLPDHERKTIRAMFKSDLQAVAGRMPLDIAYSVLDAVFVTRTYWTSDERTRHRVEAAQHFFRLGGKPTSISLVEDTLPDLLDAAGPIGPEKIAQYVFEWVEGYDDGQ